MKNKKHKVKQKKPSRKENICPPCPPVCPPVSPVSNGFLNCLGKTI